MISSDFDRHERARWSGRADAYDRSFARLCAHPAAALLDAVGVGSGKVADARQARRSADSSAVTSEKPGGASPDGSLAAIVPDGPLPAGPPGPRVLDVGTGTGTVASLAHDRGATVVAVDAEPTMLALAARRLTGVTLLPAVLPHLPFAAGAFDATVANFVVNHVGRPAAAIAELSRVTRRGGRVAVTLWPSPPAVVQRLWGDVFAVAGAVLPPSLPRLAAEDDFSRTEAGVTELLRGAGLVDVRCVTAAWILQIDPEDWWSGPAAGLATPGLILEHQSPDGLRQVRAAYDELTEPYRGPDGILALPASALLAVGVSASS